MFILQALEDKKDLHFPKSEHTVKHYSSISDYYKDMGVSGNGL